MRYKINILLAFICIQLVVAVLFWYLSANTDLFPSKFAPLVTVNTKQTVFKEIICNINGDYNVSCRKQADEVFVPFKFLHKYFEVYGKIYEKQGKEVFNWSHSYANVFVPQQKYVPQGTFTHFQSYKVEERERVKCVSATHGVPMSTQWDPKGYFYPTQIAQYGLSHYSKHLIEPAPVKYVLEDGDIHANWLVPHVDAEVKYVRDIEINSSVMCFSSVLGNPVTLHSNITLPILSLNLQLKPDNASRFTVTLENVLEKRTYRVHFICNENYIWANAQDVYYGILCPKNSKKWIKLSRDIFIDVQKGIMLQTHSKSKTQRSVFRVESIELTGEGCVDNLTSMSSDHMTHFQFAVDWFVNNQDPSGGWPNPVQRKMAGSLVLKAGWYSAMGQGHGLSVLARAYHFSKRKLYLDVAEKALEPFQKLSKDHGVLAKYMHELPWYEEYPTIPPTFVLNGFIYSLIGLYDLYKLAPADISHEAYTLYSQGLNSLKKMLMLFDTGSGTTYDLRHVTLGIAPRIARWDYHATHVNQLYLLSTFEKDPIFATTAKRWQGYMSGKRASHN
ncbi:hypothetical protein V9T40_004331 [Parthenolecanium corni]|uniref:heparosan-N-sulfate-glucuronate 5-epimerase n=1 Tax=Parthenolecanium corni TaxID=536013 RepID=A0AAN9U3B0_9HEMI